MSSLVSYVTLHVTKLVNFICHHVVHFLRIKFVMLGLGAQPNSRAQVLNPSVAVECGLETVKYMCTSPQDYTISCQ